MLDANYTAGQTDGIRITMASAPARSIRLDLSPLRSRLSTTPGRLQIALAGVTLFSLLLWMSASATIGEFRSVVELIGVSSFPSVESAGDIRAGLADMDANAANAFFSSGTKAARAQYEQDRMAVATALVKAAKNITYGDSEEVPIRAIADGLPVYTGLVEEARTLGYPKGLAALHQASDLMHGQLLSAAEVLDKANADPLNRKYAGAGAEVGTRTLVTTLCAIVLLVLLAGTQLFVTMRTRRFVNIPLAIATLCLVALLIRFAGVYSQAFAQLKRAKVDAFDSMHALWQAKATAFDANGDESFYLLEKSTQARYEAAFRRKSSLLADRPLTPMLVAEAARTSAAHASLDLKGFLGTELNNITFTYEPEAATDTLRWYAKYLEIDTEIRRLETSGRHEEAVILCCGTLPDQSNGVFDKFIQALQRTADINKREFEGAVKKSSALLDSLQPLFAIVSMLVTLLSWFGINLRLREYAG
jgi:hypothetical protein